MARVVLVILIAMACMWTGNAFGQLELAITNVSIEPTPQGVNGPKLTLHMSRSYRFQVTIERGGPGQLADTQCFTVRTECIKDGKSVVLGVARVGVTPGMGWNVYATYDVFPSAAGAGDCVLRTTIDVLNEVTEPDESSNSNVWDRGATIRE